MEKRALPVVMIIVFALLLSACKPETAPTQPVATATQPAATPTEQVVTEETPEPAQGWWNDVVFYELFVRSFKDTLIFLSSNSF